MAPNDGSERELKKIENLVYGIRQLCYKRHFSPESIILYKKSLQFPYELYILATSKVLKWSPRRELSTHCNETLLTKHRYSKTKSKNLFCFNHPNVDDGLDEEE